MQAPLPFVLGTPLLTVAGAPNVAVPMCIVNLVYFAIFLLRVAQLLSASADLVMAELATFQAKLWEAIQATADAIVPPAESQPAGAMIPRGSATFKNIVANFAPATSDGRGKYAGKAVLVKRCPFTDTRCCPRIDAGDWFPAHADADQVPAKGGSLEQQVTTMAEWAEYIVKDPCPMLYLWRYKVEMQPWPAAGGAAAGRRR
jgi:hypothetical protein